MTQVSRYAAAHKLTLNDVRCKVKANFLHAGSIVGKTATGRCTGFEIELSFESDEDADALADLLRVAHDMCYTEHALQDSIPVHKIHTVNGQPFQSRR